MLSVDVKVVSSPPDNVYTLDKDDDWAVSCLFTGNPTPNVTVVNTRSEMVWTYVDGLDRFHSGVEIVWAPSTSTERRNANGREVTCFGYQNIRQDSRTFSMHVQHKLHGE